MPPRDHSYAEPDRDRTTSSVQRSLAFEGAPQGRNETELRRSLTKALLASVCSGASDSLLKESFAHAVAGLVAKKGVLIQVRQQHPLNIEILYSTGLTPEDEAACRELRSSPGISPILIRKAIEDGEARLIADASDLEADDSLRGRPYSVLCAPIADSTSSVVAVLYLQNEAWRPHEAEDRQWLTAYVAALGQAFTLHVSGQRRFHDLEAEWRRAQKAGGPR